MDSQPEKALSLMNRGDAGSGKLSDMALQKKAEHIITMKSIAIFQMRGPLSQPSGERSKRGLILQKVYLLPVRFW